MNPCDIFKNTEHRCEVYVLLYFTEYTSFNIVIDAEVAYPCLQELSTEPSPD
jgi:hypothetical protein